MKTREQIYSKEASELLRDITTYHYIRKAQLLRLYPGREDKIGNLLSFFVRQGRILVDRETEMYHDGAGPAPDYEMLSAIWVLTDFIGRVDYHSSADFPVKLVFIAQGELYEVIYAALGNEALIGHALGTCIHDAEKRLVIVDKAEQIESLNIPGVDAYCTVEADTGAISYFKKED